MKFRTQLLHRWAHAAFELKSRHAPLMLNTATLCNVFALCAHSINSFSAANPVMFSRHGLAILSNCLCSKVPPRGLRTTVSLRESLALNTDGPSLLDSLISTKSTWLGSDDVSKLAWKGELRSPTTVHTSWLHFAFKSLFSVQREKECLILFFLHCSNFQYIFLHPLC